MPVFYLVYVDIKIWMLTGDKMETAENIAKSCNLFQSSFQILRLNAPNKANILYELNRLAQLSK